MIMNKVKHNYKQIIIHKQLQLPHLILNINQRHKPKLLLKNIINMIHHIEVFVKKGKKEKRLYRNWKIKNKKYKCK